MHEVRNVKLAFLAVLILFGIFLVVRDEFGSNTPHAIIVRIENNAPIPSSDTWIYYSEVADARIISGTDRGEMITLRSTYLEGDGQKLDVGESVLVTKEGDGVYADFYEHDYLPVIIVCLLLFAVGIMYIGGWQGVRGLVSLAGGISLIVFLLLPGVLHGYSPILLSIFVTSFTATFGAYITHGFSKMTTAAIFGMVSTIVFTAILGYLAVHFGHFSTIIDEYGADLPAINFQSLFLGAIIIGFLGVLYDAAIGQAVAVEELARAGTHLSRGVIYERAVRIGKEHIGALVNTLVLAYVGVSLPLMLYFFQFFQEIHGTISSLINAPVIATEILRITVGAIGLILTIPITTSIAVRMLVPKKNA